MPTRLELFAGKGGVGKTTLACAAAMSYRDAGERVLLASLDQAHSLGDALGFRFPHDPGTVAGITTVLPDLDVIELDSLALLEDRFRDVVRTLDGAGHEHGVDIAALDPAELTGLPGVQELLMLTEIAEFAADDDWDVIVLDCPPSADMLRIVTGPDTLLGYLERIWPAHSRALSASGRNVRLAVLAATVERIATAVTGVRDLLADPERTGARLITVAEQVASAESARMRSAAALLGLRLEEVVVNKVLPPLEPAPAAADSTRHPAVEWYARRRAEQLAVVAALRAGIPEVPVRIVHHSGPEPVGLQSLAALSFVPLAAVPGAPLAVMDMPGKRAEDAGDPMLGDDTAAARPVEAQVQLESGTGLRSVYTLRLQLPVVDPATLRLGRVEDDLIVGADGIRRRLRLAPVLRRCAVEGAELDGGRLVVRFRPDPEVWPR
ncbi:ArsA family ATPase [Nocardia albiluteola]|uniref:ArsA family ATPase n=1 Tax=Nocardia albiluteola TaxID=2842303 RepID=UPI0027E0EB9A|nr:ArsA family ATPase [Nocardia albiluteola]